MEPQRNVIDERATGWAIRLDAGPLSAEEQAELDAWMASDARHRGALVRARAAWLDADRLSALAGGQEVTAGNDFVPLDRGAVRRRDGGRARSPRGIKLLIAASVAGLAVAVAVGVGVIAPLRGGQTYASEIGEVRRIELADGSELMLNTNTLATVRYQEARREITLEQGEALFRVAPNASRPFVVHANDMQVKAVGTAFTVRLDDARVDVVVTEGVVEVSRDGAATPTRIGAGHRALLASSASRFDIEPVSRETVSRQLAWREGMVAFAGEPLSVAVAEINRHSRRPIHIDDPALAGKPVVGIFHANDAEGFANAAAATFGAEVVRTGGAIHLRAAAP